MSVTGRRAAGQDDARGTEPGHRLGGALERDHFGVDARLADAARDQLGDLAAEIDDENGLRRLHRGHLSARDARYNVG